MNNKTKKLKAIFAHKSMAKNLVISIVILVEIIAILAVATFAWVETVSSIKIATRNAQNNEDPLVVDSYVFTEAVIGEGKGTIDLADYFKKAGDMHLAPASSADGKTMYFPKVTSAGTAYTSGSAGSFRKGNSSDKNTAYMSVTFKLKADVNADFFFTQVPTFSNQSDNIRVSVTAYTEGDNPEGAYDPTTGKTIGNTKIYATSASAANTKVVGNTAGTAVDTSFEAFENHIKGKGSTGKLFSISADETKIVTINLWLQGSSMDSGLPQDITISNLGIISDLTPRHVTLIPTNRWDTGGTAYYYAWCWMGDGSIASQLYRLSLDENEHYSFDYNGKYDNALFFKSGNANLTTKNMDSNWNSSTILFKSIDTAIPGTPVDPTFIITELRGGAADDNLGGAEKSIGIWASPDIVTIKTAYVTGQKSTWGTLTSTSYYGTTVSSDQQVEANNSSNTNAKHHDTIHALPGTKVRLTATQKGDDYAFVGWYDNAAGTGTALSTSATYDFNATSEAPREITYYAKFKEVRKLTIIKYLDDVATTTSTAADVGTIKIGDNTSGADVTSYSQTYDKGTTVTFSAAASPGYTLEGIYTTKNGNSSVSSVTLDDHTTYYARFKTISYDVKAIVDGAGGTVRAGNAAAGTTSTASVKYKSSVDLVASPGDGYDFDGWYSAAGDFLSADTTYTYSVSTVGKKEVHAKFKQQSTTTIYMTYRGYSHMRVYVYGKSTGRLYNGDFPGTTVPTYTGNRGLYSYTFKTGQDEDIGIIVSDNGSDTVRDEYTAHIGETIFIGPSGSTIDRNYTLGTKRYVYFTKQWDNNYVHHWGGNIGDSSWPGDKMTAKAYTNGYSQDILYYVINNGNTHVIFDSGNNGTQTNNIALGNNSCFYYDEKATDKYKTWSPPTD